ncbi:MAG: hypothetical protein CVU39_00465 [Chloroflexi bacterium HGW-Chloroflexi-10]|nr:MAG: hypothetical protein CVU39_00465 [Chloroflexi bacterium HGW-Chloroflexi-10]
MKRYLNLQDFATPVLGIGLLLGVVIPVLLWLVERLFQLVVLSLLMKISLTGGGIVLGVLFLLIILEQIQDRILTRQVLQNRTRIPLKNGSYECPYCGNLALKSIDATCPICQRDLKPETDKPQPY